MLSIGAREDRHHGDADLNRGKKAGGIGVERERRHCSATAVVDELLQPRGAGRHNSQFRHDEEAVQGDQEKEDKKLRPRHGSEDLVRGLYSECSRQW